MLAKFRKMGLTAPPKTASAGKEKDDGRGDGEVLLGKELFRKLDPRIRSVLSRSCVPGHDGGDSLARQTVAAFESYLVSLALAASKKDAPSSGEGYPPRQPRSTYDLFERMFSSPPRVVVRDKGKRWASSSSRGSEHLHAVMVAMVHFYFAMEDDGRGTRSSAFHRILLYDVCQFHGMEASSSVLDPKRGKRGSRSGEPAGGVKAVTVQGGVLLAPALRLLDYLD